MCWRRMEEASEATRSWEMQMTVNEQQFDESYESDLLDPLVTMARAGDRVQVVASRVGVWLAGFLAAITHV